MVEAAAFGGIQAFLSDLAVHWRVSVAAQKQAFDAREGEDQTSNVEQRTLNLERPTLQAEKRKSRNSSRT